MPNGQVIPMQIRTPNIAQAMATGEQFKLNRQNMATNIESKRIEQAVSRTKLSLSLLSGVTDQESLDTAKKQFLAVIPPDEKTGVSNTMDQLFGTAYSPKRIEQAKKRLLLISGELDAIKPQKPVSVAAGAGLYDPNTGEMIATQPPAPAKPTYDVFEKGGNQIYVKKGDSIPAGYRKVQTKGVTVYTGDISKTTKTDLEKRIMEGVRNVRSFEETRKLFKPEYLTWFGKGEKAMASLMDKAGMSSKDQKGLIKERSKWFRQAKADFIAYRKWATGVAGGEKELAEIATSFPDPVKNSPTEYEANLNSIEDTTKKVLSLDADFLRSGIDLNQPLSAIVGQMRERGMKTPPGMEVSEGPTEPDTFTPEQEAEAYLRSKGYNITAQ